MPEEAFKVHGLSDDFLRDKPKYAEIANTFLEFVGDAALVIHNAAFDISFLNAEHGRLGHPQFSNEVIDTVLLARKVHPGARVSLDALCKHYGIDNSKRTLHGALLDSQILAEVYLELIGGRQVTFALGEEIVIAADLASGQRVAARQRPAPLPPRLDQIVLEAHRALLKTLGGEPLWAYYDGEEA
jgi:DNA polymerase-3 subunit epsilon